MIFPQHYLVSVLTSWWACGTQRTACWDWIPIFLCFSPVVYAAWWLLWLRETAPHHLVFACFIHPGAGVKSLTPCSLLLFCPHTERVWSLYCFSLSPFQTLKLLAITIIQRSLPAPGIPQNLWSTVGLHPISLENILEKGCRGETFPEILFLLSCLIMRILGQGILGWKYFPLRTRTVPFPRITEPEFGLCSQTLLGYCLTSLCTDNLNYLSRHPPQ